MKYTELLEGLGLSEREAEMYSLLLKLGEVPISSLVHQLDVHPQIVYRTVNALATQGLAHVVRKQYKKYVQVESPRELLRREQRKLEQLKTVMPGLMALREQMPVSIVRVSQGRAAVKEVRLKITDDIESGGLLRVMSGAGRRFYEALGRSYKAVDKRRIDKRIRRQLITYRSEQPHLAGEPSPELTEFRFLEGPHQVLTSTLIGRTFVAHLIWSDESVVLEVESPEYVRSATDHFDSLWHLAKP